MDMQEILIEKRKTLSLSLSFYEVGYMFESRTLEFLKSFLLTSLEERRGICLEDTPTVIPTAIQLHMRPHRGILDVAQSKRNGSLLTSTPSLFSQPLTHTSDAHRQIYHACGVDGSVCIEIHIHVEVSIHLEMRT